ncbi:histidine ammonia-lyase [Ferroplasma sp.]|uniref:histidine ammonia-lyase n=1 Tax=Ferroplasma sp. TaxID=2591003 RepID=UPI0026103D3A|nr:histidine ammonia-lyase [Ferroplasma sp.]
MIYIDGNNLTIEDVNAVATGNETVDIAESAYHQIRNSKKSLMKILESGKAVYGVNTGFGSLLNINVDSKNRVQLQINLIRSHSSGIGEPLDIETVKSVMLVRANTLVKGYSGVSEDMIKFLLFMINENIIPVVPRYGSVGASGDLAPLAHIGLAMMGEGDVFYNGEIQNAAPVFRSLGKKPYSFAEKEGVALINGTSVICGILALEIKRSENLVSEALGSFVLSFEGLSGTDKAFTEWALASRPHEGQQAIGRAFRTMLHGSRIVENANSEKVQDAYSLRCVPQVYGAVWDTLEYSRKVLTTEINSATDNPLLMGDEYISTGNFHGEPVAMVSDFVSIAMTDFGNMIERRLARIVDTNLSGLPPFLVKDYGLNSGYMIPQYTAAALCNVNKTLVHPNSADTIPTSANQEDHVSMGTNAALKLAEINKNVKSIIAIEYLLGSQSLEFRKHEPSPATLEIYNRIRLIVKPLESDRSSTRDIVEITKLLDSEEFLRFIKNRSGFALNN